MTNNITPGESFAKKIKQILLLIFILNMLFLFIHTYHSYQGVKHAESSLIKLGEQALRSFEGGRQAFLIHKISTAPRFKRFVEEMVKQSEISAITIFDSNQKVIFSASKYKEIPKIIVPQDSELHSEFSENKLYVYKAYRTVAVPFHHDGMMGNNNLGQGRLGSGRGFNRQIQIQDVEPVFAVITVDTTMLNKIKKERALAMGIIIVLQILIGVAYLFTIRFSKIFVKQTALLEKTENEAEMGRMGQTLAHEIKNPISSISGLISYADKKIADEKLNDIMKRSLGELKRLDGIVNDFLNYGKEIVLNKSDVPLNELLEHVKQLICADNSCNGNDIIIEEDLPVIHADKEKMTQVFFNILLNAIQASPDDSPVYVKRTDKGVSFVNEVNSEEKIDKASLFRPFYTTKTRGTGLGLALVNRICNLHGFKAEITKTDPFTLNISF